ncbi:DUF4755 domain-containing protein [Acetobacter fabarum]|uniref:DUF4755 domain-containing protein n=1 Tax=Acetobacter fabarum TaxID=483199 RepID=UPI00312B39DE
MIIIEKISDGINIKQATPKYEVLLLFFKIPTICASFFTFLLVLFGGKENTLVGIIGLFVIIYVICLICFPLFWVLKTAYLKIIGVKAVDKKYIPILNEEYSNIKQKIDTYQKPIIYADYTHAILQCHVHRVGWSKVMAYPNFIAFNGRDFFMTDNIGRMIKFNWDDVRQWSHGTQTGGMIYGGSATDLSIARANDEQALENAKVSGFFVTVKDVNQPKWQFKTSDESLQNKWMEIFRQVKDGTLKLQA